jgi:hypothetical protein
MKILALKPHIERFWSYFYCKRSFFTQAPKDKHKSIVIWEVGLQKVKIHYVSKCEFHIFNMRKGQGIFQMYKDFVNIKKANLKGCKANNTQVCFKR